MILDNISNIDKYKDNERIYKALSFLKDNEFKDVAVGRYELDGDTIYYMVQEFVTEKERAVCEGHKKYIDIQYIVSGEEAMGYAQIDTEKTLVKEDVGIDCWFYKCESEKVNLFSGDFIIFYPEDLHKPCLAVNEPEKCKKVVVKVKID